MNQQQPLNRIFYFSDIRYSWLLLVSMAIFLGSVYYGKINPQLDATLEGVIYGSAFVTAVIWGLLNYLDHIQVNAIYRRYDNIDSFVDNLLMPKDEKRELKAYLEDYAEDLASQGKSREEAEKTAIDQFRVQEIVSLSKSNGLLNLPTHYYLIGCWLVALGAGLILRIIALFFHSFWLAAFQFMLFSYSVGFLGLFFLYSLMNIVLSKRIVNQ